jgi:hypothetical protein
MIVLGNLNKHIIRINENQYRELQHLNEINYVAAKSNVTVCSLNDFVSICKSLGVNDNNVEQFSNEYAFIEIYTTLSRLKVELPIALPKRKIASGEEYIPKSDDEIQDFYENQQKYFKKETYNVLHLEFDDNIDNLDKKDKSLVNVKLKKRNFNSDNQHLNGFKYPATNKSFFTNEMAIKVQNFVNKFEGKNIKFIIHCTEGMSRSAAIGYYIAKKTKQNIESFFSEYETYRDGKHQFKVGAGSKGAPHYVNSLVLDKMGDVEGWNKDYYSDDFLKTPYLDDKYGRISAIEKLFLVTANAILNKGSRVKATITKLYNSYNMINKLGVNKNEYEELYNKCISAIELNESAVGEGGVFHVNNIGKDGSMNTSYEYLDDINNTDPSNRNVYVDFSNSGLKYHPASKDWVEIPKSWSDRVHQDKDYEKLGKKPRPITSKDKGMVIAQGHKGKFYMPTRQNRGQGDNIGIRKAILPITSDIQIPCYNLSLLGRDPSTATMLAHMYKGKPSSFSRHYQMTTNGLPQNIKSYLSNMANLFKNDAELSSFVPDYIVYPQSSSGFNNLIAKSLRYIYPNAKILDKDSITKIKVWGVNYDTLVDLTMKDLPNGVYRGSYSRYQNNEYLQKQIISNTIYRSAQQLITNSICRSLNNIISGESVLQANNKAQRNAEIFAQLENVFNREYDLLSQAMNKKELTAPNKVEMFRIVLNMIFTNQNYGRYSLKYIGKNSLKNGGREALYYSIDAFKKAFIKTNPDIDLNFEKIKELAQKNDTIKNYDANQRFAIKGQFKLSQQASNTIDANSKILILDDNYATGVSLRNAAILFLERGIPQQNIITMTPGDMGSASTGGKRGSDVPFFDAEGRLANDYVNGKLDTTQIDNNMGEFLTNKNKSLEKNIGHSKRNKLVNNGVNTY